MAASTLSERLRAGGIVADPDIVVREASGRASASRSRARCSRRSRPAATTSSATTATGGPLHLPGARRHRAGDRGPLPPVQGTPEGHRAAAGRRPVPADVRAVPGAGRRARRLLEAGREHPRRLQGAGRQRSGSTGSPRASPATTARARPRRRTARTCWPRRAVGRRSSPALPCRRCWRRGSCAAVTGATASSGSRGGCRSCTRRGRRRRTSTARASSSTARPSPR